MQPIPTAEFLAWAAEQGIGWDPRYPRAHQLSFLSQPGHWRSWEVPADVGQLAWFVEAILRTATPEGGPLLVFPYDEGRWQFGGDGKLVANDAFGITVRGAGVPRDFAGAVRFEATEFAHVLALASAALVFGVALEDLYIVPADGRCILMTDHHNAVIGSFRSLDAREAFARALVARGYEDPELLAHG